MGLFSRNYNKEGKGVEKDEAPAPGFLRIWQLFFRNFNKMMFYGIIMGIVVLPLIVAAVAYVATLSPEIAEEFRNALEAAEKNPGDQVVQLPNVWVGMALMLAVSIPQGVWIPILIVCALLYGPLTCGLTYCVRNHVREEHVWLSDIFTRAWKNKWQGLFFGILDILITVSTLMYLYAAAPKTESDSSFLLYLQVLSVVIYLIYQAMRWYIYQMIVTFNLKITGLLKNAWMFVILGSGRNLIALVFTLMLILFFYVFPVLFPAAFPMFLVLAFLFSGSIIPYSQVFITYPVMHKYLVAPALAEQEKKQRNVRMD
ncbi:MAG TPA: hypothetical protein GX701_08000 [Clostridiales bacterium]|nr:hypothetical protein [Clostridiales bacterium]